MENDGRVFLLHAKNNLAPPQKGLAFELEQRSVCDGVLASFVRFENEHVSATADEALRAEHDPEAGTDKQAAIDFLQTMLAEGPCRCELIQEEARAAGLLSEDQSIGQSKPFRSARKALGIKPYQPKGAKAGGWIWALPDPVVAASGALVGSDALQKQGAPDGNGACDGQMHPRQTTPIGASALDDFPELPECLRRRPP